MKKEEIKNKKANANIGDTLKKWLVFNKKSLLFALVGVVIGILVMGIFWPKRIASLKDGTEPVVNVNGQVFTADDLYGELKSIGGLSTLLNMIDMKILNDKYDVSEEAEEYAKKQAEYYYSIYESYYGYTKEQFLASQGYPTEEFYLDILKQDFVKQKYYQEYLTSLVSDNDIEKYYKDSVFGDREVYLFSSSTDKSVLESVRSELKKGTDVDKIEDKYSKVTVNNIGTIDFQLAADYEEAIVNAIKGQNSNEYSKVLTSEAYGYVVVYVKSAKDKPTLEDARDKILEVLTTSLDAENENLYYQAFIKLRDDNKIKFSDTGLAEEYETFKKQYK